MLTKKQIASFQKNGYLVVENVFDDNTILSPVRAEYSALLDKVIEGWVAEGKITAPPAGSDFFDKLNYCYQAGCDWFQPLDISLPGDRIFSNTPMHFGPAIFNLLTYPNLLDIVGQLIGPEITSNPIQHVRLKPPITALNRDEVRAHIAHTDWHQDRGVALHEADNTNMVTVWCAITDATVKNGCLQVIPRTVDQSLLPHCPKKQTAIADGFIDESNAVPLPVKSGGIVLFHPLTPHSSLSNQTDSFRWSFDIRFNTTGEPTGRAHFPEFIARSPSNPSAVLSDWQEWRGMWEAARTRLAEQQHIDIHRWSSDAPACA